MAELADFQRMEQARGIEAGGECVSAFGVEHDHADVSEREDADDADDADAGSSRGRARVPGETAGEIHRKVIHC